VASSEIHNEEPAAGCDSQAVRFGMFEDSFARSVDAGLNVGPVFATGARRIDRHDAEAALRRLYRCEDKTGRCGAHFMPPYAGRVASLAAASV
jgi:hypothetical protein